MPWWVPIAAAIGGGLASRGGRSSTSSELDSASQRFLQDLRDQYYQYIANRPLEQSIAQASPESMQAIQGYGRLANLGMGGVDILSQLAQGNYGQLNPIFAEAQRQAIAQAGQAATGQGAFGGSRQAVLQAVLQGDVANRQAMLGYDAANRLANLGLGANQALFGAGDYLRQIQQQFMDFPVRNVEIGRSLVAPYGQTTSQSWGGNPWAGALGGYLTAQSLFGNNNQNLGMSGYFPSSGMNPYYQYPGFK